MRLLVLFCLLFVYLPTAKAEKIRRFSIGPSAMYLVDKDALKGYGQQAIGLQSLYEFVLSEHFSLGIDLTYRVTTDGDKSASQTRYGLIMKHDLDGEFWRPYVAYGLLMQVIRLQGVKGDGTAHDTKLAAGLNVGPRWFIEAAYHVSRLRFFNTNAVRLDYVEANGGYVFRW